MATLDKFGAVKAKGETWKYDYFQTIKEVRQEIEKPFEEKLRRTKQLVKLFANSPGACLSCSFGKDSMAVLHLTREVNPKIPVNFTNTLIEYPETIRLMRKVADDWVLNLSELRPEKGVNFWTINDRIINEGLRLDDGRKHSNICCVHLKEKPFRIWHRRNKYTRCFTGITAMESRNRLMGIACMKGTDYYSYKQGIYKIHPILYWTDQEVWNYTRDNNIPVNEAYKKYGIKRIGCMFCMSHKGWRQQVCRLFPKVYDYMMRRYFNTPRISDPLFHFNANDKVKT